MKIKILKTVSLDINGKGYKTYIPNGCYAGKCRVVKDEFYIDDVYAKEQNLMERYSKFPEHIRILEPVKIRGEKNERTTKKD